jgi:hypothetical protein
MSKVGPETVLRELIDSHRATGRLDELFWKGHVAAGRIAALIGVPKKALYCNPESSALIRSLAQERMLAVPPPSEDVGGVRRLAEEVLATGVESRTELARSYNTLYKKVVKHPDKEEIFQRCGLPSQREGLGLLSDQNIIARCGDFSSLTELKYGNEPLHQQVKGRRLERQVTLAHGWCNFSYAGLSGLRYRSRVERVVGNLLEANRISFDYDGPLPGTRPAGSKPLRYDFRLREGDWYLYIEVLQNDERYGGREGHDRKAVYARRLAEKRRHCADNDLLVVWLNSECFSTPDRAMGLAQLCIEELAKHGVSLVMPPIEQLFFSLGSDFHMKTADQILNNELSECRGIADFQNHYSRLRNELKHRPDYPEIENELRERGKQACRAAAAKRGAERLAQ